MAQAVTCDVCGISADHRIVTLTFHAGHQATALCALCEGLIESGLIRPETAEDGSTVYRQWHQEWRPGELVAKL